MKNQALLPSKTDEPGDLSEDLAGLAKGLARELVPASQIRTQYGLNEAEFDAVLNSAEFTALLEYERAQWAAPENTNERIRLKGLMATEAGMLSMADIANDPEAGPIARIKAFAELVRVGGADNAALAKAAAGNRMGPGSGDRFSISIHIGGEAISASSVDDLTEINVSSESSESGLDLGLESEPGPPESRLASLQEWH